MLHVELVRLRKAKKLTQEELAEKLGITRSRLSQYELGTRNPDYETLQLIASYFGVTRDQLLGGKESLVAETDSEMEAMKREIRDIVNAAQTDEDVKSILHIMRKVMKE